MKYEFCRPDRFCKVVYIAEDQFGGNRSQAHQPSQSCHNPGLECFELERVVGTGGGVFVLLFPLESAAGTYQKAKQMDEQDG